MKIFYSIAVLVILGGLSLVFHSFNQLESKNHSEIKKIEENLSIEKEEYPKISYWKIKDDKSFYSLKVQPIFDKKCIACHSCYNSPCQLNLTSLEGLMRGASKDNLYDFPLLESRAPSRLYIDASSSGEWHSKGFFPVVNRSDSHLLKKLISMENGVESGLQKKYDSEYSRFCIDDREERFKEFKKNNPAGRMPYGFPGLSAEEIDTIFDWSLNVFDGPNTLDLEAQVFTQDELNELISSWENFFNQKELKNQIVSRYLYEHLFIADIYFESFPNVFFKLVAS